MVYLFTGGHPCGKTMLLIPAALWPQREDKGEVEGCRWGQTGPDLTTLTQSRAQSVGLADDCKSS